MSNYLTVGELVAALKDVPPDTLVVLQKGVEGYYYSPIASIGVENQVYEPDGLWAGEVRLHHLTDALRHEGYSEDDIGGSGAMPCVCLRPVN